MVGSSNEKRTVVLTVSHSPLKVRDAWSGVYPWHFFRSLEDL
jgi:hypothetical protein